MIDCRGVLLDCQFVLFFCSFLSCGVGLQVWWERVEKRNHACVVYLPVDWLHCYVICLFFRVGHRVGLRCECGGNEWRSVITFVAKTQMMMDTQMKYTGHCRETQRDIAERHRETVQRETQRDIAGRNRETLQRDTERHCGETYRDFAERDIQSVHTERDTERYYREENRDIAERDIAKRH